MSRKYNFYAGPATLPLPVLTQIKEEMEDFHGIGMSLIETSHRSKTYDGVHNEAITLLRELLGIPANYQVIFLGGGATLQFSMIPLNFLAQGKSCDFTLTGAWAKKAYDDAVKVGKVNVVFDGKDSGYTTLPAAASLKASPGAAYFHLTSNETIEGVEWVDFPDTGDVPLIADMSSDIMSRPLPVEKFGVIYAGAQKNLGPAGVTLVIMREDLLARCPDTLTAYLNYKIHADKNSLYNTPPVFSIYALKLVLEHVKKQGGLAAVAAMAAKKAGLLYRAIDDSDGFFRSRMNVVFRLPSEELEKKFIDAAAEKGMVGLKGHRSVGGCRASLYNAMPEEGVAALTDFMKEFAVANG
jgi:phosphoserine aminotransferase